MTDEDNNQGGWTDFSKFYKGRNRFYWEKFPFHQQDICSAEGYLCQGGRPVSGFTSDFHFKIYQYKSQS